MASVEINATVEGAPSANDLELLQEYEPVIRYTQGELFFPMPADDYLRNATLFEAIPSQKAPRVISEAGTLETTTLARLGHDHDGKRLYLQFVSEPLSRKEYRQWRVDPERPTFTANSRFDSVGLLSGLIDSTMRSTQLLRGRVPGGYAAAAHRQVSPQEAFPYYGRVVHDAGYVVLQYWYLYAMNDWRSTFGGIYDHEADWELVSIFLAETSEGLRPAWVACSSHDEVGDDLRRRWDDPDITFVDSTHPVIYAGAGSHAGAYLPGDYVISVGLPIPHFIERIRDGFARLIPWSDQDEGIGIPYIDYRRGDGVGIGPGHERQWTPVVIDDETDWVRDFRGLWGTDTRDALGGERAPAGPRYHRDGSVRDSWRAPAAWAGLDKIAATEQEAEEGLQVLRASLEAESAELDEHLARARAKLRGARVADRVVGHDPRHAIAEAKDLDDKVATLRQQRARLTEQLEAVDRAARQLDHVEPVHAHLRRRALPLGHAYKRGVGARLLRTWAVAFAALLLGAAVILLVLGATSVASALLILVAAMVVIEAAVRQRLLQLLVSVLVATHLLPRQRRLSSRHW